MDSLAIRRWRARREVKPSILPRLLLGSVAVLFLTLFAVMLLGVGALGGVYWYYAKDLPPATDVERITSEAFQTSIIYDATGEHVLYQLIDPQGGARTKVSLADIPEHVRYATVAMEDKTFYTNPGVDIFGIIRAFVSNLQGNEIQGASTLTQQLIKLVIIPEEERYEISYARKIKEAILSLELSRRYPGMEGKDKILEWYLNTIHYGRVAYGIQAAAEQYFGKNASELTLAEGAMLVAVPQYPLMNPIDNFDEAKKRQETVLDQMYLQGYITAEEAWEAKQEEIVVVSKPFEIQAPHFVMYVRQLLEEQYGLSMVYRKGLRVYTTLELDLQAEAERIAREHIADNKEEHNVTNAAVVVMDPHTGKIRAMVGSLDYFDAEIDGQVNVATSPRQPGSSFKPFTYVTALAQGYTPATRIMDVRTSFDDSPNLPYVPENYDRQYHGPVSIRRALACSYNVPAVAVLSWVGVDNVLDTAHRMGINTLNKDYYGLSLTLGGGEVTLLDMAYAYSVFANEGIMAGERVPEEDLKPGFRELNPVAILRVEDAEGNVLYEYKEPHTKRVISEQLAYLISDILSDNHARSYALGPNSWINLSRPAAAKTGTTENFVDAWTIGYTPDVVVGVWIGNNSADPMEALPSVRGAGPIYNRVMEYLFQSMPEVDFREPPGLVYAVVDEASGLLPTAYSGRQITEVFIEGTVPTTYDDIHRAYRVCKVSGKLATVHCPAHEVEEQVFEVYPPDAADWVRQAGKPQPPVEYCDVHGQGLLAADVAIGSPNMYAYVRKVVPVTGNAKPGDFSFWRLQFGQGMNPSAWTPIGGDRYDRVDNNVFDYWDVSQLDGLYSLELTVVGGSGSVQKSAVQVTVDNISPTIQLLNPWEDKAYVKEIDEWVNLQVLAEDNASMDRVEFFIDDRLIGYSTVAPFTYKWNIVMSDTIPSRWIGRDTTVITDTDGSALTIDWERGVFTRTLPSGMTIISTTNAYTETHMAHAIAYDSAGNWLKTDKVRFRVTHKPKKEEPTPTAALLPGRWHIWQREDLFRIPIT